MDRDSDELSTDISSSLSSPFGKTCDRKRATTASSQVERLDEADKQILEWAGKLEMESVDLREKSSQLVQVLQSNSEELCGLMKKLEGGLARQGEVNELPQLIEKLVSRMERHMSVIERQVKAFSSNDCGSEFKKVEKKLTKCFDERQQATAKSIDQTHDLLFNVNRQLEDIHQVLTSMSEDVTKLNDKQISLEQRMANYEVVARKNSGSLPDDEPTLLIDGPITRSMSKKTKIGAPRFKKVTKPRDSTVARTIIPWEEVDMYYTSEI